MNNEKYLKKLLKIAAIFLWYFTPLFFLIISDVGNRLFQENSFLGNLIVRFPYQWDHELMFAGFCFVWGIFVWRAAKSPENNKSFIQFTAWGFLVNALTNILVGLFRTQDLAHLVTDSIPWLIISFSIFYLIRNKQD